MSDNFLRSALLAGVLAFAMPAGLGAQENGDDSQTPPSQSGPEVNTETAGDQPAAGTTEDNDGCPTGSLETDEAGTATPDSTAEGTDADLTNCAENEPSDQEEVTDTDQQGDDGTQDGGAGGTDEQGSDDSGTNTGG
jgi:hypothetical protein